MRKKLKITIAFLIVGLLLTACTTEVPSSTTDESAQQEAEKSAQNELPAQVSTEAPTEAPAVQYEISYTYADAYKNSIGSVYIRGIVGITNTGSKNLYISSGSFDFEDATGALIATENYISAYPEVIQPGETSYMYTAHHTDGELPESVTVIPHEDVEEATVDCLRLPVSETTLKDGKYSSIEIMGRVANETDSNVSLVYVCAIMKDADGNPVCVDFTILNEIKAGDKVGFSMSTRAIPDSITATSITSFEVYAYPMQIQF